MDLPPADTFLPPSGEALVTLATTKMPFGRYAGTVLLDLPESYLLWFRQKGFPPGTLGRLMALAFEIRVNGLERLVEEALQSRGVRSQVANHQKPATRVRSARHRTRRR